MPRPRSLTQAGIAAAALAVIDRDGLPALSMRAVATELGMGTMSLYRYVSDREELETWVVDHVLSGIDLEVPPRASWQRQLTVLAERLREAVAGHPATIPLLVARRHAAPSSVRWIEATLGAFTRAGFTGKERVIAQRTLVSYLLGALQSEHYGALSGAGTAAMAALPGDEFPLVAETAALARTVPAATEFRRGLTVVLRGLEQSRRSGGQ
ncbi:TetR/AcrR family transcriptional regulator [Amycolatopsis suaedae]|uniref:TetR family transcriptional regulator n=1 Tax=Amycolatopsis suaedae TaxID=2510978 RepID=A0A4Q7J7R5_9PSEU|nr:TetR/AcrR family transcriptional regulator C-terminal domain-containing protein [Amycolatopsis suaedae]RZQ62842.1 TetR family transcriptional regulator [Amycolatopsis suaedae]